MLHWKDGVKEEVMVVNLDKDSEGEVEQKHVQSYYDICNIPYLNVFSATKKGYIWSLLEYQPFWEVIPKYVS